MLPGLTKPVHDLVDADGPADGSAGRAAALLAALQCEPELANTEEVLSMSGPRVFAREQCLRQLPRVGGSKQHIRAVEGGRRRSGNGHCSSSMAAE